MRKKRWIAVAGAVVGLWLLPSVSLAAELKGGLKIGLNLTDIHGADVRAFPEYDDPDTSWFMKFGFCGGGFIAVDLSKTVALQAEALITMKGSAQTGYPLDLWSLRTTYLEIPLLLKLTGRAGKSQAYFLTGPALGLKLSGVMKQNGEPMTFSGIKSTDMGFVFGFGGVTRSKIMGELRYTMGLSKFIERDSVPLAIKNTAISLMVGYMF